MKTNRITNKPFQGASYMNSLIPRAAILLTMVIFFFSCQDTLREEVVDTWEDGTPKRVKYYTGDQELAKEAGFYEDGSKMLKGSYTNGKRHGQWSYYYNNGNLWSWAQYHEGNEHGPYRTYYSNGQIRYKGEMSHGERSGLWRFYGEDGEELKQVDYDNPQ